MAKKGSKRKAAPGDVATNRQASFRYELIDRYEAGIQLVGSEVKSLRAGRGQLKEGHAAPSPPRGGWVPNAPNPPHKPPPRRNPQAGGPPQTPPPKSPVP